MTKLPSLSMFFPAFNEERNIRTSIAIALRVGPLVAEKFEILVIDDASTDGTASAVRALATVHPEIHLIPHSTNKGYGGAVKTGLRSAQYEYIFFTDSDCQFDLHELSKLVRFADRFAMVIGYRKKRMDSRLRLWNAKGWNLLNRVLFDLHIRDIDCAFKLMRRDLVQQLDLVSDGAMVSAELLIRLKQQGIRVKEVAVTHRPRRQGLATGAKPLVILRAFGEMARLFFSPLGLQTRHQFLTFGLIGVVNTLLDLGVYFLLVQNVPFFASAEPLAKVFSFLVGVTSSFVLNSVFTFQSRDFSSQRIMRFLSVSCIGLLVNTSVFSVVRSLGIGSVVSVLFAAASSFVVGFVLLKMWVFQETRSWKRATV